MIVLVWVLIKTLIFMLTDFMNSIKQKIKKSPLLAFRFAGQTCLPAGRDKNSILRLKSAGEHA